MNKPVVILGAGLTGLTTAWWLRRAGLSVVVLEKLDRAGGVMQTTTEQGFVIENGPGTGVLGSEELVRLFESLSKAIKIDTPDEASKNRWIWKSGKWNTLPTGVWSAITTPLFTPGDKVKILGEPFRARGTNPDETVAGLVRRRLGQSFLDYAIDPFISGIYAGNPASLVTRFALPKLYALEQQYGSFVRGAIAKSRMPKTALQKRVTREVFSVQGGFGNLTRALVTAIGDANIRLGCGDVTIMPDKNGFVCQYKQNERFEEVNTTRVISTIPGYMIPSAFPFLESHCTETFAGLRYAPVVQAAVGYNYWQGIGLKAFGGLIPSKENRRILGILFPSSLFKNRAPADGALLSVFAGGIRHPEVMDYTDDEIRRIVLDEIALTLGNNSIPNVLNIFRYKNAIPQYESSSGQRLAAIEEVGLKYPGLILAGNISDGIGIADRVKQAITVAERVINEQQNE